jgi:chitin synthase
MDLHFHCLPRPLAHRYLGTYSLSYVKNPVLISSQSAQYILLSPTYTNVINVYAFCNTHDVTWGTKGDDKPEKLKTATVSAAGKENTEPGLEDSDLNVLYDTALEKFSKVAPKEDPKPNPRDVEEGYNKAFRSYVVLAWMFCNAALVAAILNSGGLNRLGDVKPVDVTDPNSPNPTVKVYLLVILWSVAALSGFKFIGAMWYRIHRIVS